MMNKVMELDISGLGIIFYSESSTRQINDGEDYFSKSYSMPQQVARHVKEGRIVGFGTGSPGVFDLRFYEGYPADEDLMESRFKLRLGIDVKDNGIWFRDLYDLMYWDSDCPENQYIELDNGYYHVTLFGGMPDSGILGDNQTINIYLQKLDAMPDIKYNGVPMYSE